ncbi:unnamed protein product [Lepeophtheirus salmonis]|uniref:(salmon louse) hypothetical protein n=1 Tax=Lepeophtheirus salmonis TaxID=72036 RepID=A0A7R8H1F1_LEPSM|nr:unnamed protein product [Lepeophtheirus salmonis]CAF2808284.1 unnamed protein product [Lepeophtheirus salmonis]
MKPGRLELYLKANHSGYVNSDLSYFKSLKENFIKRPTIKYLLTKQAVSVGRTLEPSYEISLVIAKCGKNDTIGEDLINPSISVFLKTVIEKVDKVVKAMPLSNNTITRRIDEMGKDIETQHIEKFKSRNFSLQMDESTLRDSEVVLLGYARYIDKE